MTTPTDRKSGFGNFPAKGVQPLPTEPVQIYEDSPFWNKVRDMAEHTDRIRQMAQEAGFSLHSFNAIDGDEVMAGEYVITEELARFAQLVAEDLTADDDALAEKMAEHLYGHPRSDAVEWAKEDKFDSEKDKALDLIAVMREHIRARYSLKD